MGDDRRYIIFGAGVYGRKAFEEYGEERVAGFMDNSPQKQGTFLYGKPVMRVEDVLHRKRITILSLQACMWQVWRNS